MENIEHILNHCLNKALCQKGRIQQPSSNTIADFVSKYIQDEKLIITDVGCSLPSKEAMYFKELEEYKEEKEWDNRVNRRDFAKGFISCYKWITNQEFKVR